MIIIYSAAALTVRAVSPSPRFHDITLVIFQEPCNRLLTKVSNVLYE